MLYYSIFYVLYIYSLFHFYIKFLYQFNLKVEEKIETNKFFIKRTISEL